MSTIAAVIGRLLIGLLFIFSGFGKIIDPAATASYITSATTLPGSLALPTGIFEVVAGVLLAIGLMTRLVAILLAGFVALTIFFFHNQFADPAQQPVILQHFALIGGLLAVFAYGQVKGTFDYMRERRKRYDADLRAARAEGRAEGVSTVPTRTVVTDAVTAGTVTTDVDGDGVPEVRPKRRWF
jgi:putative oxidoreductase